ncbi:MAG: IS1595 family transposase [Chloroflexi bacterium]|nr:IS1595 family transposase [Chloroflexota bacterium]
MYKQMDVNIMKLMEDFDTDKECRDVLVKLRWPNGVGCVRCGSTNIRNNYTRSLYDCGACGFQFSVTTRTIFHDTHLPLPKWFVTIYLMCESKKGMSANQIKRTIGVSYKTAWYLCHRIRAAMQDTGGTKLSGTVEADETYVGGKVRGQGHGYKGNKAIVVGVVQRKGQVRLQVVDDTGKATLHGFVKTHTAPDTENIYTDEHPSYAGVGDGDTRHATVNHRIEEWVRGDVHTNGIESVWSLLKRSINGSFHHVSVKHLDSYLDELEWRQNNKENAYLFRDTLMKLLSAERLEYKNLTA